MIVACFTPPDRHEGGGTFFKHCMELWKFADDKGVYRLTKHKMSSAVQAGKKQLFHRLSHTTVRSRRLRFYVVEIVNVSKLLGVVEYELSAS